MDGLAVLVAITLANIDLCCIVYLGKAVVQAVYKVSGLKGLLKEDE